MSLASALAAGGYVPVDLAVVVRSHLHQHYQRDEHRVHCVVYHLIWCPKRCTSVLMELESFATLASGEHICMPAYYRTRRRPICGAASAGLRGR